MLRVRPASPPPKGPGPGHQAALALETRELWIAAHVPRLSLLALRAQDQSGSLVAGSVVVIDPEDHHQRLIDAEPEALAAGVRIGMTLGAALAAAPGIDPRPRNAAREQELLQRLAGIAADFTPQVSIEPPDGLLLEIKPSIRLFGGLRELCRRLRAACRADPVLAQVRAEPHFTLAPTALAALVAARGGARCFITDPGVLPARLKPLSLALLRWSEEHNARLVAMGVRTLGELMRLPRAGFARRFGPQLLADLDRLLGRRADPRARLVRRERYGGSRDFDHEIEDHERILRALAPLLQELEQFLRARQRGIRALQCRFHHYRAAPTRCTLRLAAPEASAERLTRLLRERLATLVLPEPVRRCELRSGALVERAVASQPLWSPGERGHASAGEMPALIEHLRARLGNEAVYGITRVSEHRPENAWCVTEPKMGTSLFNDELRTGSASSINRDVRIFRDRRPLWLLKSPQPLDTQRGRPRHGGPLELLAGPERIESGWWDGGDIQRDYYVAQDAHGSRLWIYRECTGAKPWFLHGIFG
ncbi:MAG TPA: DNA polymerase Y family protein [Steroidobacteraceae bacterium]|nr:DNA polymerase Y family protein [Steroidobacteraceae bacterium]